MQMFADENCVFKEGTAIIWDQILRHMPNKHLRFPHGGGGGSSDKDSPCGEPTIRVSDILDWKCAHDLRETYPQHFAGDFGRAATQILSISEDTDIVGSSGFEAISELRVGQNQFHEIWHLVFYSC